MNVLFKRTGKILAQLKRHGKIEFFAALRVVVTFTLHYRYVNIVIGSCHDAPFVACMYENETSNTTRAL
jgi:hypothetical protein